jgi:hypothetical protein
MQLVGIANQIATLGDHEPNDKVVLKYMWLVFLVTICVVTRCGISLFQKEKTKEEQH